MGFCEGSSLSATHPQRGRVRGRVRGRGAVGGRGGRGRDVRLGRVSRLGGGSFLREGDDGFPSEIPGGDDVRVDLQETRGDCHGGWIVSSLDASAHGVILKRANQLHLRKGRLPPGLRRKRVGCIVGRAGQSWIWREVETDGTRGGVRGGRGRRVRTRAGVARAPWIPPESRVYVRA